MYPNLFKAYNLKGAMNWLPLLSEEDLKVFVSIGLEAAEHGKLGGKARAASAKRDQFGRFIKKEKEDGQDT